MSRLSCCVTWSCLQCGSINKMLWLAWGVVFAWGTAGKCKAMVCPGSICALPTPAVLELCTAASGWAGNHLSFENAAAEPELPGCQLEHLLARQKWLDKCRLRRSFCSLSIFKANWRSEDKPWEALLPRIHSRYKYFFTFGLQLSGTAFSSGTVVFCLSSLRDVTSFHMGVGWGLEQRIKTLQLNESVVFRAQPSHRTSSSFCSNQGCRQVMFVDSRLPYGRRFCWSEQKQMFA